MRDKQLGPQSLSRLPLATGESLVIEPLRTVGGQWLSALAVIGRHVARQNILFDTEESMRDEGLVVASPAMRHAVERVIEAAGSGARVLLLTGPSGAGKEGLARCFHRHTKRAGAFVARNCSMFSKELVRSELFGAEKGAFTGSVRRIVGAVELASEGTLFLDELGDLPREVQPMLLRFLDHGEFESLGNYGRMKTADVRIVAATNRDLRAASAADSFRSDLWFRLSVHVVSVPPLRERAEDVVAFLRSYRVPSGRPLLDALGPGALATLTAHEWQGNFRELVNFCERSAPLAARGEVSASMTQALLQEGALRPSPLPPPPRAAASSRNPGGAPGDDDDLLVSCVTRARAAYVEDRAGEAPRSWDEVKDYVENYVKPILFAELSRTSDLERLEDVDLRAASDRVRADRGTASKQLRRFFDRFASRPSVR